MAVRTLSTLPISVGTGLAVESLVKTPLSPYSSFLINVRTLIRNAINAYEKDYQLKPDELAEAVFEDMSGIAEALAALKLSVHIELIFYYPSYSGLRRTFPLANLKVPKTEIQIKESKLTESAGKILLEKHKKVITSNDVLLPSFSGEAIIITSHPVDLATCKSYTRLNLLESYTGTLKKFPEFYTKLTSSDKLTNIPLNKLTIQIFGDDAINFYAIKSLRVKNEIKRLADEAKWSTASTPSFVISTIKNLKNSPDKDILLKLI